MTNPKDEEMADSELRLPPLFELQLYFGIRFIYMAGELEALETMGQSLPSVKAFTDEIRCISISKIKALWESFCEVTRQQGEKDPEKLLRWFPMVPEHINKLKSEFDHVAVSPSDRAMNDRAFQMFLADENNAAINWFH